MEKYRQYLTAHGIRPSSPRLKIFEYLFKNRIHPTADEIYRSLLPSIPGLSKTTVYNTMKLFVVQGVVFMVNIEDHEVRFDADTTLHGHFKCKGCGMVFDFPIHRNEIGFSELANFQVDEFHFNLKGYCKICRSK